MKSAFKILSDEIYRWVTYLYYMTQKLSQNISLPKINNLVIAKKIIMGENFYCHFRNQQPRLHRIGYLTLLGRILVGQSYYYMKFHDRRIVWSLVQKRPNCAISCRSMKFGTLIVFNPLNSNLPGTKANF